MNFSKENPVRSLVLLASGAVLGLALAGYGLFTAPGSTTNVLPEGAIALVNHRQILLSDYRNQLESLYEVPSEKATPEQRKAVLDSMLAEELLVQRGLEIDLAATDAAVREALVAGVQLTSTADIVAKKPSTDELKDYFEAHRDKYRSNGMMMVRDLVVPLQSKRSTEQALKTGEEAAQALRKGVRVEAVVTRYGLKEAATSNSEEQLDIAVARSLGEKLFAAADKLAGGQVSDPMVADDGLHILVMVKRRPAVPLEFKAARDRVASDMAREAQRRAEEEYVQFLRGKAEILLAPGFSL